MRIRSALIILVATLTWIPVIAGPAAAGPAPCSRGLVALTFDDGPARDQTPRLLDILGGLKVNATFFVVGQRVAAAPRLAARIQQRGHAIGNHSWSHPDLTRLSDSGIRGQLDRAHRQLRGAGVRPSKLMRPPYGAINSRVRGVIRRMGLVPVLWDIDTRDWESGTSRQIADRVLNRLRAHRSNIVLLHDGVRRSVNSVGAVERIVRRARAKGYCFTTLANDGTALVPVPILRSQVSVGAELPNRPIKVRMSLDRPTSRAVSVVLNTFGLSAKAGADFATRRVVVRFPVGVRTRTVQIRVLDDLVVEGTEKLRVRLSQPRGVKVPNAYLTGYIRSNDVAPPPPTPTPTPTQTTTASPG
ncbi:MAG: hypothetical protein EOO74_01805 [Myxococcales bacterium]|nr:MAG: hypothetical protein EOO74_01805 [Myxococcales bacterium]